MTTILHIAERVAWQEAERAGTYQAPSLAKEGFIHCSTHEQVLLVANAIFRGRRDLVLLEIDTTRLAPEVRYENLEGGERLFPHVYGPIAIDAVRAVHEFQPRADGAFELPGTLSA